MATGDLLTGPEAAALCGVEPCTIRQWKRRGILTPTGLDERGRPLYDQVDVANAEEATRDRGGRMTGRQLATTRGAS